MTLCPLCLGAGMRYLVRTRRQWPCPHCEGASHAAIGAGEIRVHANTTQKWRGVISKRLRKAGMTEQAISAVLAAPFCRAIVPFWCGQPMPDMVMSWERYVIA